jgi:hypothetical protein
MVNHMAVYRPAGDENSNEVILDMRRIAARKPALITGIIIMGKQYTVLTDKLVEFIKQQKLFFVGTAAETGRVNISPKGLDSLRVIDVNRIIWLNLTGSGNETAAHVQQQNRMTLMFCAFEGNPMILRVYGQATVVHQTDPQWRELSGLFEPMPGARQIFDLTIDLVQTSCGFGVPYFDFVAERDQLDQWALKKGPDGISEYWQQKNAYSIDGMETHIVEKNLGAQK